MGSQEPNNPELGEADLNYIHEHFPESASTQFKETFPQELSPQEEKEFKKRMGYDIKWLLQSKIPPTEQEIEAFEVEEYWKERVHLLVNKVLLLTSGCTDMWISLINPNTGGAILKLGHYENIDEEDDPEETVEASLRSGLEFIRSVAFC